MGIRHNTRWEDLDASGREGLPTGSLYLRRVGKVSDSDAFDAIEALAYSSGYSKESHVYDHQLGLDLLVNNMEGDCGC